MKWFRFPRRGFLVHKCFISGRGCSCIECHGDARKKKKFKKPSLHSGSHTYLNLLREMRERGNYRSQIAMLNLHGRFPWNTWFLFLRSLNGGSVPTVTSTCFRRWRVASESTAGWSSRIVNLAGSIVGFHYILAHYRYQNLKKNESELSLNVRIVGLTSIFFH